MWRILLLSGGMLVFLALVAAASRAHHVPGSSAGIHSPPAGVGDYLFTMFLLVVVVGFLFLVYIWFSERDLLAQAHRGRQKKGTYRALIMILLIPAIALAGRGRFHIFQHQQKTGQETVHGGKPTHTKQKLTNPAKQRPPKFEFLPIAIATAAGLVFLGYLGVRSMRRARTPLVEQHLLEREFESLLDDTLDDLYANPDARAAIIAAYARMEQLFAARGFARDPAETSMEFLSRCVGELRASGAALGRLTGLFQRAKFSPHEVGRPMRDEAIEALTEVRDELRALRLEDELRRAESAQQRARHAEAQTTAERDRDFSEDPFKAAAEKMRGDVYTGGR
ncbi:MAG: DUF4129 domain-containing protein [Gaiellaceae bacterium]